MADGTTGSAVPGVGGERTARAAHGQELAWLTGRRFEGQLLQHVADTFRVGAATDEAQLRSAFGELALRHTALRTSLRVVDGELWQVVHPRIGLPLEFTDLRGVDDGRRAEQLAGIAEQAAAQPFDPGRAPLWRAVAVRLGETDWAVALVAHQLVCDPASLFLLNAELVELCAASEQGRTPVLPELPRDPAGSADRRQDRSATELRARNEEFWREQLAGLPPGHGIPLDRPRPAVRTFAGAEVRSELPPGLPAALRKGADRLDAAPAVVLLAAYAALLHGRSGRTDHGIGVPVSGRHRPETLALVGALAGTVVLRLDTSGDPDFAELVDRVRGVASAAWEHQGPSCPHAHQLAFSLTEGPDPGPPCGFAEADLLLEVAGRAARLVYDSALFAPVTARGLLGDYLALLAAALAEPATPLSLLLSLLPGAAATRPPRPAHDERTAGSPTAAPGPSEPEAPRGGRAAPSVLLRSTT
ncbi:condensation domain-containing protein [Kitasatospora sp. NPDC017646]|uniref:condensation domain-containing protein n=1 Tax=Kitasatospora sp. NPDC017646 TaxID=3364024 RepID=UPI00378C76FD